MKQCITKLLSVVLAVVLVMGLLPATALAWAVYDVWVSGVQVTGLNAKDVLSDGGSVVFTSATGGEPAKLTLKNADIVGTSLLAHPDDNFGIYSEIDLTLELHGANKITAEDAVSDAVSCGIYVKANLVIEGDGTLDVTAAKGEYSSAIEAMAMTMRGCTVRATAGDATGDSCAVFSEELVMEGGTLEATACKGKYSCAIETDKMTIRGGAIRATAGEATKDSEAVYCNDLVMEGGTLEAKADKGEYSCGVDSTNFTILGGTVRATGGEGSEGSYGVYCNKDLVMEGGTLEATSGKAKKSCAIDADEMTVRNGTIRATAGEASEDSSAVYSDQSIVMEGGTLEATAGKAEYSFGVDSTSFTILGGTVRATGGEGSEESYGVFDNFKGEFIIEGGVLIAAGGPSDGSYGIYKLNGLKGGTVTAIGQTRAYYNYPMLDGFKDPVVTVSEQPSGTGAVSWNDTDSLNYDLFKYVRIAPYNPFTDVPEGQYYYEPVLWAIGQEPQITTGTSADRFSPNATCTRAQVVTFLWRASGEPEPTKTENPFSDVKEGQYYYKAVLWAVEKGITTGTSADKFSPNAGCTRGQVVTFLHRAQGKPMPGSFINPFTDVAEGQYYYAAVLWAVHHSPQITTGTSADRFSPDATCTRGQIVTFLYRSMK